MDQAGADKQWVRGPFSAADRAARAIRVILSKVFKLVVTNFFDDFCQLELGSLRQSAWTTAETVMNLLGWSISAGDDKRRPFFFFRPTPDGSRQVVYQAGKTIAFCKFTELMQWQHQS